MEKIDFVVLWVDGNDPQWQASFRIHLPESEKTDDTRVVRYRDWDNLRFWFRGVEKFAPWVNRIHFVTCGQVPEWLNLDAPKLHYVQHEDFIPKHCLPTFSANPIEINMHRIKGLAEHFVFFNDDFFLINKVLPSRFFHKGLPCDMAVLNALSCGRMVHLVVNDLDIINAKFDKRAVIRQNLGKWFNLKYRGKLYRTFALLAWPYFTGFYDHHLPQAFLKSTLKEVWGEYGEILEQTTASKFRRVTDVNQWLFRYWHLAKGEFSPINVNQDSIFFEITDVSLSMIEKVISRQSKSIIVLNDGKVSSFEGSKERINRAFDTILPDKSVYEK